MTAFTLAIGVFNSMFYVFETMAITSYAWEFFTLPIYQMAHFLSFTMIIGELSPVLLVAIIIILLIAVLVLAFLLIYLKKKSLSVSETNSPDQQNQDSKDQKLSQYIYTITHDLRTPLNSISALSELLTMSYDEMDSDEVKSYAQNILNLALRINHMINNLSDVNSLEQGDSNMELKPVSVKESLNEVYDSIHILGENKSIKTELIIPDKTPSIHVDEGAFSRVIENLVNNAYKFSSSGDTVTIEAEILAQEQQVKISIKDEGPGFSDADKKSLYNKFTKLSAQPTGNEKSTGLGLYIVRSLVISMNGSIELESEPGNGAVFSLYFPAVT